MIVVRQLSLEPIKAPVRIVQFQGGISQCIGNVIGRCTELGTYGTNNYLLWASPLNNEPANHHVVSRLYKAPRADVA